MADCTALNAHRSSKLQGFESLLRRDVNLQRAKSAIGLMSELQVHDVESRDLGTAHSGELSWKA